MHNPESIGKNKTHKIIWNLEIQTYHLIQARIPDNQKRICCITDHTVKMKENETRNNY